jgi:hypothetical protein
MGAECWRAFPVIFSASSTNRKVEQKGATCRDQRYQAQAHVRSWPNKWASTWNKKRTLGKTATALPLRAVAAGVRNRRQGGGLVDGSDGANVIRLGNDQQVVLAVASTLLKDKTAKDRLWAEKVCRTNVASLRVYG